jgi:hypothetical protein
MRRNIVTAFHDLNIGVLSWRKEEINPKTAVRTNYIRP